MLGGIQGGYLCAMLELNRFRSNNQRLTQYFRFPQYPYGYLVSGFCLLFHVQKGNKISRNVPLVACWKDYNPIHPSDRWHRCFLVCIRIDCAPLTSLLCLDEVPSSEDQPNTCVNQMLVSHLFQRQLSEKPRSDSLVENPRGISCNADA